MLTFMCELAEAVDATHTRGGVRGWDGVGCYRSCELAGGEVNVHVNLQKQLMLRTRGVGWGGWGGMLTFM